MGINANISKCFLSNGNAAMTGSVENSSMVSFRVPASSCKDNNRAYILKTHKGLASVANETRPFEPAPAIFPKLGQMLIKLAATLTVLLFAATGAKAQGWSSFNYDEDLNNYSGVYITNEWFDNWYFSLSGGLTTRYSTGEQSDIKKIFLSPEYELNILKWFTPSIGARLGFQNGTGKEGLDYYNPYQLNHCKLPYSSEIGTPGNLSYGYMYVHGDFLWNLTSAFGGFDKDRFFNTSAYFHTGYMHMYDNSKGEGIGSDNRDREYCFGLGCYNQFRITDRFSATLDARYTVHASRYRTSDGVRTNVLTLSAGIAYNIYRTYWNRASGLVANAAAAKVAAKDAQQALDEVKTENVALEREIAVKDEAIANLTNQLNGNVKRADDPNRYDEIEYKKLQERVANADLVLYFYINSETLNFSELHHFDQYVRTVLETDPNHVFYITGSADKGTGTMARNLYLSGARAKHVKNLLIKNYGVEESNIVIKATVVSEKHIDGALDRCVLMEKE